MYMESYYVAMKKIMLVSQEMVENARNYRGRNGRGLMPDIMMISKKISNDQELIQSDPIFCP